MRYFVLFCGVIAAAHAASIRYDSARKLWTLESGVAEYRLQQQPDGAVRIVYFGPLDRAAWPAAVGRQSNPLARYDIDGQVDGQTLAPEDLRLESHEIRESTLKLIYIHKRIPLAIEAIYTAWGDTGVFTRQLLLLNRSAKAQHVESAPSLSWCLPPGPYQLDYLHGLWGQERQLASQRLPPERVAFVNRTGRSSDGHSAWFALRNEALGVRYAAQLAYSGNWEMFFERHTERRIVSWDQHELQVQMGMRFDFGGPALLPSGGSLALPVVAFTTSKGDLDDIANQLHRYQRRYMVARTPANTPMMVQFNSWYPLQRKPVAADVMKLAASAKELGVEAFVIDAGWFSNRGKRVDPIFGDWDADPVTFPKGLREVSDFMHANGMKFGVWLEIECAGIDSKIVRAHPDWVLRYAGQPMPGTRGRVYLNFGNPEVRKWTRSVVDRLVREDKVDWFKLDYNVDVGERFDPPGPERTGTVLYQHLREYFKFLDAIRRDYPNLVLENCSSGGLRMDLGIIAHTDTTWLSDVVNPRQSVQLAYGCTMEFTPQVCNHWMVGDEDKGTVNPAGPPEWWDFMLRIPMNGQFGLSSRILEWNGAIRERAKRNVEAYKRNRELIAAADVYHLTPPPDAGKNPTGWMALEYCGEDRSRALLMAYRLEKSEASRTFLLRGLDPERTYKVVSEGGAPAQYSGRKLQQEGLPVMLDSEWRSAMIEIQPI